MLAHDRPPQPHMTDLASNDANPTSELRIHQIRDERGLVLELRGELDLASAPLLEQQLTELEDESSGRVLIDMRNLTFMDSTGLALLIRAEQAAQNNGHQLRLRRGSKQVQRLFELTGVVDRFTFDD
jgi:anti-sigma B factor antagonist